MFTSALPVRAWRGGVAAGEPRSVSATQRLTDAGAPLGTSEADARRTMLQACERRKAAAELEESKLETGGDKENIEQEKN